MRIGIVGGSLGGLFAAALLQLDGHQVEVFERSRAGLAGRGAGLVGQREIFAILREVGCEHVAHVGVVARERVTLDRYGRVIDRQETPQTQISWDHLYKSFLERIEATHYHLDRNVRDVVDSGSEAVLYFSDGTSAAFDLVIGADGLGSAVRQLVAEGDRQNIYAGYVAWRGLFPESQLPSESAAALSDRFTFFTMPRSHMLGYTVAGPDGEILPGQRRYNWVWYRAVSPKDLRSTLTDLNGTAHPFSISPGMIPSEERRILVDDAQRLLPSVFAGAVRTEESPFVQAIFDYETSAMARGRVALLGDAAFVVRPHTAMGVAKAAGDVMSLRKHLRQSDDLVVALRSYSIERMPVGRSIAAYGRRLGASLI